MPVRRGRLRSATPAWDSNSPDSDQAFEIRRVATDHGYCLITAGTEQREIERSNSLQQKDVGFIGLSGWEAGIRAHSQRGEAEL
jgi:hypothetical protein